MTGVVAVIASIIYVLLLLYFFVMWARFILDIASNFARNWRPRGAALIAAEMVFTVTDPPLKLVRRVIPPIRFGGAAIDLAWSVVMLVVIVLIYLALGFSRPF